MGEMGRGEDEEISIGGTWRPSSCGRQYVAKGQFQTQEGQPPSSSNNGRILSQAWMAEHLRAAFDQCALCPCLDANQ